jgi:hypothetical protein
MDPNRTIGSGKPRAGEKLRINEDRLFYVDNVGWYIHTREGLNGPYPEMKEAESYVAQLTQINRSDLSFVDTLQM